MTGAGNVTIDFETRRNWQEGPNGERETTEADRRYGQPYLVTVDTGA
jgi:hypothetical protein